MQERAQFVARRVHDVAGERAVELDRGCGAILVLRREHFAQHIGVAADRALAEHDQAAREDVGALHGNGDRDGLVATPHPVVGSQADALAAMDVHRIVNHLAYPLGHVIFHDGRND